MEPGLITFLKPASTMILKAWNAYWIRLCNRCFDKDAKASKQNGKEKFHGYRIFYLTMISLRREPLLAKIKRKTILR